MFAESFTRVADHPDVHLFVTALGSPTDSPLLVIHGGPDWDHYYLREPLDKLAGYRILLPDLRGCGRSSRDLPDSAYTWDAIVEDLTALLDAEGIQKADVLGFSSGGLIAQRLAVAAPERIRRLVIASSAALPVPQNAFADWPEVAERRRQGKILVPHVNGLTGADLNRAAALMQGPANVWRKDRLGEYQNRLENTRFSGEWLRVWNAGLIPHPRVHAAVKLLSATELPMLFLHGRQDMTFPAALAEEAADMIPSARVAVLEDAGHMAHIDQPERWLASLEKFLN